MDVRYVGVLIVAALILRLNKNLQTVNVKYIFITLVYVAPFRDLCC